ncbi:hypothetical protein [Pantoea ananatis]|uniref:hypothetical protein n=1 Tax=Pantoea ananas TaxID=553 RepID=UPI001B30C6C6|nr:hypothetical protein [Pantoea ananatis]
MEWIKDFFRSIRSTSLERINSPVSGAFAFSWFFWNWKSALLILFGDSIFEERLSSASDSIGFFSGFLLPAISTFILCFYLPRVNQFVSKFQKEPNYETMEMAFDKKKQILLWDIELEKLSAQSSVAYEEEKATLQLEVTKSQKQAEDNRKQLESTTKLMSELQARNIELIEENERLMANLSVSEQEKNDFDDIKKNQNALISEFEKERAEHEVTREKLASATSEIRSLYIENQQYKNDVKSAMRANTISN